ncbi:hypothetical protein [Mucilaginibacter gossypiicola]|uniref:hypothetical protein n=1 Tax=Mucilaginibacter gossypiicola TaxID=551995 RepID=UPI00115FCE7D|nr:hypothetical protein [Mucilaginibacter gossypiicola]
MTRLFKHIVRLSLVAIIFFSLQGEVIVRYVQIFRTGTEHATDLIKKNNEHQRLVKLQCYTQKFHVVGLPPQLTFAFSPSIQYLPAKIHPVSGTFIFPATKFATNTLRGPPRS